MLGDNIIRIRELRGINKISFAKRIGISPGYLSDIENNIKKNPSLKILGKMATILEVESSELISTEEKLSMALTTINDTIEQYYESKTDKHIVEQIQLDAETNLFLNKIKKLSIKERRIVEVLVDQLLKEE